MLQIFSPFLKKNFYGYYYAEKIFNIQSRELHGEIAQGKSLVQVQGTESFEYFQGLITNDIAHLQNGAISLYSMLLNTQGRVLFDVIIHKKNNDSFLVECDSNLVTSLIKHLKMYKVRRKINIDCVDEYLKAWVVFDPEIDFKKITQVDVESLYLNPKAESEPDLIPPDNGDSIMVTRDPRMKYLGHRLILPASKAINDVVSGVVKSEGLFKSLRYKLGVGEGAVEHMPGKCLPLEANVDYLHGVSFHKGCYIGQELTARSFHTGVIRKRFMPLIFMGGTSKLIYDTNIVNEKGKSVGKIRGCEGQHGLGLMRIEEALAAESLTVNGSHVQTFKPAWWPIEASKEKQKNN